MRRVRDQHWLRNPWDRAHPDDKAESFERLGWPDHGGLAVYWPHWMAMLSPSPRELLRRQAKRKVELARYAKQPIFQWDNVEASEVRLYYNLLCEVIDEENSRSAGTGGGGTAEATDVPPPR